MQNLIFEPSKTSDFVFSDRTDATRLKQILSGACQFPSTKNGLLLYGSYGTGKTTYAEVFIDEHARIYGNAGRRERLYGDQHYDIDKLAKLLDQRQGFRHWDGFEYVLLDEVDNYTHERMNRLKGLITKHRKDVVFVMTTNNLNEIPAGIKDRSVTIEMNQSNDDSEYVKRLRNILLENKLTPLPEKTLRSIVKISDGSWRNLIENLQACINTHQSNNNVVPMLKQ